LEGIDFLLDCYPIDVTTNPRGISHKVRAKRYTTLFLPKYIGQTSIVNVDKNSLDEEYILSYIQKGKHKHFEFFNDLVSINQEILQLLTQEITSGENPSLFQNSGLNNEKNLRTILKIITETSL
jgi:hypothetical protein